MRQRGMANEFAEGDSAWYWVHITHLQKYRPLGKYQVADEWG